MNAAYRPDGIQFPPDAYCVQCETGKEAKLAHGVNLMYSDIMALTALQERHRSVSGVRTTVQVNLLPGYVFLYAHGPLAVRSLMTHHNIYRFLSYGSAGDFVLRGADSEFANWIYRNDGLLACSKAVSVGSQVKVIAGPLVDCAGTVEKVDKHNRNICLAIPFDGVRRLIWMPFEWTDSTTSVQLDEPGRASGNIAFRA